MSLNNFLQHVVRRLLALTVLNGAAVFIAGWPQIVHAQANTQGAETSTGALQDGSPMRLRSAALAAEPETKGVRGEASVTQIVTPTYVPGEFEMFVQNLAGRPVRRLGAELTLPSADGREAELGSTVPPDYVLAAGDEVLVLLWGSVEADLRLTVDRGGRVSIPRVGAVQVAGIRYDQLTSVIEKRVSLVFRNFQLSVTLGKLRGMRVFVTGYVNRPGTYNVSALSTMIAALMQAGGPSASGSFRRVEHKRGSAVVGQVDLYDLILDGDRSSDRMLQAGDVIHVSPVGVQVAVIGSVNNAAVMELRANEGVARALQLAGGFSALADRSRLSIERLGDRNTHRVTELKLPADAVQVLAHGDVLRAFSAATAVGATAGQNKRVRVDGEVQKPGEYVLPPNSTLQDALATAGGLTPLAYVYGTQFSRNSVRETQQENYDRALQDLETDIARAAGSQRVSSGDQVAQFQLQGAATSRLVERLRALKPSGRVVLQLVQGATSLPALVLEDGDRLYIPPRPTTVGVFGSVFNAGSYLHAEGRAIEEYLRLAGGPTKGADEGSIFIVRSTGQVISGRQTGGNAWFGPSNRIGNVRAEPGDTVFVPEEMDKSTLLQAVKDWTQILFQFGIGIAGITNVLR